MAVQPPITIEVNSLTDLPPAADPIWHERLTAGELSYCAGLLRLHEHLGARNAAKHAVAQILGWPGETPWRDIEILRRPSAPPSVELSGRLDGWRRARDLPVPGVSLTHDGGWVAALAWIPGRP